MSAHTPMAEVAENFVFFLRKQEDGSRWPVGTKLYAAAPIVIAAPELLALLRECQDAIDWCAQECGHKDAGALSVRVASLVAKAAGSQS